MQPEQIIGQLLGALVGRKRRRRPSMLGMALGRGGRGTLLTGGTLLTAAGLVWGALESMQKSTVPSSGASAGPLPAGSGATGRGVMAPTATGSPVLPPPLPGATGAPLVPPPLPGSTGEAPPDAMTFLPLVQLAISAARADGDLSDDERSIIQEHAATVGLSAAVAQAMTERPSLDVLAGAFTSDEQREAAYAIAYAVMRGDGVVSAGERMYLTQLGRLLRLSSEAIDTIERDALGKE